MKIKQALCFDDVLLVPKHSSIKSRKEIDLASKLKNLDGLTFHLPIVSSPMDTVTGSEMAAAMSKAGGLGIIHRYNTIAIQMDLIEQAFSHGAEVVGVAVGVAGDYADRASCAVRCGAQVICVDIAHGHHTLMERALKSIKDAYGNDIHVMAGNVATEEGFSQLARWGADSVRVGIGGGSICSTRIQTGHGVPTFQSILDCVESQYFGNVELIADGGIRNSGDIVKAYAAGADFVMLGSLLAGTDESPGDIVNYVEMQGDRQVYRDYKVYRGMASVEAQIDWRGHSSSVEGVTTTLPIKGPVDDILASLENGIRSGLSYSGARTVADLYNVAEFILQSSAGGVESSPHILK